MKVLIQRPIVVAKRGVRGFIKTRFLTDDKHHKTTVVDCSIERVNNFMSALKILMGDGNSGMPVRLTTSRIHNREIKVPLMDEVIKFVRDIKVEGDIITGTISGNYDNYEFKITPYSIELTKVKKLPSDKESEERCKIIQLYPSTNRTSVTPKRVARKMAYY